MVNPIYIFITTFAVAFLLPVFEKISKKVSELVFYGTLLFITAISSLWFYAIIWQDKTTQVFTAGFHPPLSINLQFGAEEAFFVVLCHIAGLLGAIYLHNKIKESSVYLKMIFLTLIMGVSGVIMTRDLFNLFVFLEIVAISTYALIGMEKKSIAAGFKYMIAGGIASAFFLIGTIYLYKFTGTLNIDLMIYSKSLIVGSAGSLAIFLLFGAILIELKPFPANGWALDVYQSAHSGVVAMISVVTSGAMFFAFYKVLPILPSNYYPLIAGIGITTFVFSNLLGLKQTNAKRLLGYSSIAQMGLILGVLALILQFTNYYAKMNAMVIVVVGLFINHFFAKAGLFWLAGVVKKENIKDWAGLSKNPILLFTFGAFIFALIGLPPFPSFWAKWELLTQLASNHLHGWIWVILFGSLLEAIYLLRWFGIAIKGESKTSFYASWSQMMPILTFLLLLLYAGLFMLDMMPNFGIYFILPIFAGALLFTIDWFPAKVKAIISMLMIGAFAYFTFIELTGIYQIFAIMFLGGGVVQIFTTMNSKGERRGFYPLLVMMLLSLGTLLKATTTLQFFFAWELMTMSSYLLILRGKQSTKTALLYIVFSLAGAYLLLTAFAYIFGEIGSTMLDELYSVTAYAPFAFVLLTFGFLIKSGALGVHIWLSGSYAESENDVSPIISSVLSKVGIFGIFIVSIIFGKQIFAKIEIQTLLGWVGILTALFGALMAVFQEDIKKLLAYSSMGQVGYMVLSVATMSHLGWTTALYLSFNHLFFKAILFIAFAGVISRTKTRKMYEMGGLIKKMPISFFTVMIAIIALSGVPPLTGFGGKWMLYNTLIEKGWYLQAGIAFFASSVAFLYCYRLIHTVFLGQEKTAFKNVKEASIWYIIPQVIFVMAIMVFSMFPSLIIKPITSAVSIHIPTDIFWNGNVLISELGYWNGSMVMNIVMGVFMVPLIWLLIRVKSVTKVKQFNIVFAAERPHTPETTHIAHNFFAPYQRALGFLVRPLATKFWNAVAEIFHSIAASIRQIYTGNGQTYALHILMYLVILYFILGVK
ncbi:MAG: hypothetical protein HN952_05610 [Candidatus Cloacimonetes bacterium]|jgi:formate hydrogenlyase subunit 3/multisubunit Na+/H+ antiporter MnhD subunit|nr:hypothetical protein [Candidatus Cloacimonadota bacterium]MBT7469139.1 hypothetical protein [Candidatus Cloacimonadota bacterium]